MARLFDDPGFAVFVTMAAIVAALSLVAWVADQRGYRRGFAAGRLPWKHPQYCPRDGMLLMPLSERAWRDTTGATWEAPQDVGL